VTEAEKRASLPKVALVGSRPLAEPAVSAPSATTTRAAPERSGRKLAMAGSARHSITGIGYRPINGGEVIVRSDHALEYGISAEADAVLLHLPAAAIPLANNRRPLDTRYFPGPVARIVPVAVAGGTDVRIELKSHAAYQLQQSGPVLTVTFAGQ
jgi:hypothetical protein